MASPAKVLKLIVATMMVSGNLLAFEQCFTSVTGHFQSCKVVCEMPDRIGIFYPDFFTTTDLRGSKFFYTQFKKANASNQTTKVVVPKSDDFTGNCGMSRGCDYTFENFAIHEDRKHPSEPVSICDGPFQVHNFIECRHYTKLLASCVTDKRTIYVRSENNTIRYSSFDFANKNPAKPSTEVGGGMIAVSDSSQAEFRFKFKDEGGWGYELVVSTAPARNHPMLLVTKDGNPLRQDSCSSYALDPELIQSTLEKTKQVAVN